MFINHQCCGSTDTVLISKLYVTLCRFYEQFYNPSGERPICVGKTVKIMIQFGWFYSELFYMRENQSARLSCCKNYDAVCVRNQIKTGRFHDFLQQHYCITENFCHRK